MKHSFPKNHIDVLDLNLKVKSSAEKLVLNSEDNYFNQLNKIAKKVHSNKDILILLLAGPSASAKTTTALKLKEKLKENGTNAVVISLDDFYVDRSNLPILPDGSVDYETIHTLDLDKIEQCLGELLENRISEFPIFDFSTGLRSEKTKHIELDENSIVIIEGLHALNPKITEKYSSDKFLKLYISPYSNYYLNDESILKAREVRLIRRIIRDYFHRSSSLNNTLEMWENVIKSEIDNILPFRETADIIIDSTIIYEPCIYSKYLIPLIEKSEIKEKHHDTIEKIKNTMEHFLSLDISYVPQDTVLHEFLD